MLINNYVAFMFNEIRCEFNDMKIDRKRNVGITSMLNDVQ